VTLPVSEVRTMIQQRLVLISIIVCAAGQLLSGAPQARYDDYLTGNAADAAGETTLGIGLMGGGTDVDALFTWMSDRAGGGDLVVIRASGADGYNQYVFDLGDFDSVETLVLLNRSASFEPDVLKKIANAEALFIAGGDQSDYVNFWKGTPVEDAIHELAAREIPIAGTSAGTAILTEFVYAAQRKSATSAKALADPFDRDITLDRDFLDLPHMGGLISDQHLIERDRLGRTLAFMARIVQDGWQAESRGIAIDRETAVLVDASGDATIVANPDHPTPYAYFIRGGAPEVCLPKTPLTYRNLAVFRARPGSRFDIPSWSGHNGTSYSLDVVNGVITSTQIGGSIY
jgi:cyanophycinase